MVSSKIARAGGTWIAVAATVTLAATRVATVQGGDIYEATLAEPDQKTQESARSKSGTS